jgi:hypothetical protein
MKLYIYEGPVLMFNDVVQDKWVAETMAVSEKKARTNLSYRWKKKNGYEASAKITLPGPLKTEE